MKKYVLFNQTALTLKNATGAIMHKRYPWFLNFYIRKQHPDAFYPVYGLIHSEMMDRNTFVTGLISIQFILVNDWKSIIGYSGHSNVFRKEQFKNSNYIVDPGKILHCGANK